MLCRGDRPGFRRASRADPQGRILTGGADKAERRRAPGAVRPLGRQAPQCPAVTAAKENDPGPPVIIGLCRSKRSRSQSATAFSVAANSVVIRRVAVCRVRRVRGVSQRSNYRACDCTAWKVGRWWRNTRLREEWMLRSQRSISRMHGLLRRDREPSATGHSPAIASQNHRLTWSGVRVLCICVMQRTYSSPLCENNRQQLC